ncbi:MAG: hypothetical protein ACFFBP_03625 [Promethearchaeota archaeon]
MSNAQSPLDLDNLLKEISSGELTENQLKTLIKVLYYINQEIVVSKKGQTIKLRLSKENIDFAFQYLLEKGYIEVNTINNVEIFSLSDKTKDDFNEILNNLNISHQLQHLIETIEQENAINSGNVEENAPSFIGCFIADKSGKTLLIFEIFEGALESFIKGSENNEYLNPDFDIELIPMFVSALEKFSRNINMQKLSELRLTGINLKIQTFSYEKFTVTFFINPNVNLESVEDKIKAYFKVLFDKYKTEFEFTLKTGIVQNISHLNVIGREMLKELNKYLYLVEFKNVINALKKYDQAYAKSLYNELSNLYKDCELKFSLTLEKIKKLKIYLLKTMLNDDLEEFKKIITKTQQINSKLNLL